MWQIFDRILIFFSREFYYIQMEKYARQAISEGVKSDSELRVNEDSELYRVLNVHYNRNNHIEVIMSSKMHSKNGGGLGSIPSLGVCLELVFYFYFYILSRNFPFIRWVTRFNLSFKFQRPQPPKPFSRVKKFSSVHPVHFELSLASRPSFVCNSIKRLLGVNPRESTIPTYSFSSHKCLRDGFLSFWWHI